MKCMTAFDHAPLLRADGAALFYVTDHRPATIVSLRKYILYRLFERQSSGPATGASTRRFRLDQKPSTVDRDTVFVPTGWDSYGKIKALRGSEDSFDCANTRRSWESDVEIEKERRRKVQQEGVTPDDPSLKENSLRQSLLGKDADSTRSAVELFEDIVGDWHARDPPAANGSKIAQPDMQAFLAQHYATLQKDSDTKKASEAASGLSSDGAEGREMDEGRSIMGPMAASGFSILPKLETPQGDDEDATASALRSSSKPRSVSSLSRRCSSPSNSHSPLRHTSWKSVTDHASSIPILSTFLLHGIAQGRRVRAQEALRVQTCPSSLKCCRVSSRAVSSTDALSSRFC